MFRLRVIECRSNTSARCYTPEIWILSFIILGTKVVRQSYLLRQKSMQRLEQISLPSDWNVLNFYEGMERGKFENCQVHDKVAMLSQIGCLVSVVSNSPDTSPSRLAYRTHSACWCVPAVVTLVLCARIKSECTLPALPKKLYLFE